MVILSIIVLVIFLATQGQCANIIYKVISTAIEASSETTMGIIIDNGFKTPFLLHTSKENPYIFEGYVPAAHSAYKYAKLNKLDKTIIEYESFDRIATTQDTVNESYNRSRNSYLVPGLPQFYPPLSSIHRLHSQLHSDSEIPTLFFSGKEEDINELHLNSSQSINAIVDLTYIGNTRIEQLTGVEIKISGRGTRGLPKASYKIKTSKDQLLFGYRKIKLRALGTDPAYIREKLAFDVVHSVGIASTRYSFVRVYINNKGYGLFGLEEDFSDPWIVNEFNNGATENYPQGSLYNGAAHAPLAYLGENETLYTAVPSDAIFGDQAYQIKEKSSGDEPANFRRLIDFTRFLAQAPTVQPDAVKIWDTHIDTESVIRSMVLEMFLGNSDGYIAAGSNYYLYSDLSKEGKFIFIPYDMDMVLGSSSSRPLAATLRGKVELFIGYDQPRPLLHNIFKVPEFKARFVSIFNRLIDSTTNLFQHIDALSIMVREDVEWDRSIVRDYHKGYDTSLIDQLFTNTTIFDGNPAPDYLLDFADRLYLHSDSISFEQAINGTLNRPSILGLKEWISKMVDSYTNNTIS